MQKLIALFDLFRVGHVVSNPAKWKAGQITATALAPVLVAFVSLAKAYGVEIPLSEGDAASLAGGIVVVVNLVLTLTTSAHVGILPAKRDGVDETAPAVSPARSDDSGAPEGGIPPELHGVGRTDPFSEHGS